MILRSLEAEDFECGGNWLAEEDVWQWLAVDGSFQGVNAASLQSITCRESNFCQIFTSDTNDLPIGLVGFSGISRSFQLYNSSNCQKIT